MIKALFLKKNNFFYSFKIEGHAGYECEGNDIVCAGVSSAVDMTINAIKNIIKQDCHLDIDSSGAMVFLELKNFDNCDAASFSKEKNNQNNQIEKKNQVNLFDFLSFSSVFIEALYCHIVNISRAFPDNVKVVFSDV